MKKLFILMTVLLSLGVHAAPVCDFPYDLSNDEGVSDLRSIAVTSSTRLTALQEKQVIATAVKFAKEAGELVPARPTLRWAIKNLAMNSEAGDVSISIFRFRGVVYSIVEIYPGGNAYGFVFKGLEIVSRRSDGDLVCDNL